VIVPPEVVRVPEVEVISPVTEKVAAVLTLPAMARFLKAKVPEFDIVPPVMVIVPAEGEKFAEEAPTVRSPLTEKLEPVVTVAPAAIERAEKVRVLELDIEDPLFMVTVPPDRIRLPEELTERTLSTTKLVLPVVTPVEEMVRA
jgi:hypothetical protein